MANKKYNVGGVTLDQPFKIQRLGHIGLTNDNNLQISDFWCDNLGFRMSDALQLPGMPEPMGYFASVGTDHHTLTHIDVAMGGKDPFYPKGITVNQISFQVGTLEEVAEGNSYFNEQGFGCWRYARDFPGSNWANYTYDPDGFRVELFYGMEQVGWDRRSKPLEYHDEYEPDLPEPSEMQEVLKTEAEHNMAPGFRPEEPMPYDYVVGGIKLQRPFSIDKIGPVYIFVDDLEKSREFYEKHAGLTVTEETEWQGHRAIFLRCNSNHHVMGLFPLALREKLDLPDFTKLFCFGIELGSYQQLRDAVTWLKGRNVPVRTDIPQELHPGIGHAAMVTDPNGHSALLFCGMEQVGWDGKPRPAESRPTITAEWPETLEPESDTYMSLGRLGPMG